MKTKVIIDCDPGHDDALAVFMASAFPEILEILAISTVGGNQKIENVTQNAANLLTALKSKLPLIRGANEPLIKKIETGEFAHGSSGMDGPVFSENHYPIIKESPFERLKAIIENEEKVTLICLGPLTNIALLLKAFPEINQKIACIALMGGGIDHGNMTPAAEFNIYVDPEAAQIVFSSGIPIVMAGLDVTEKSTITKEEFDSWENQGSIHQLSWELLSYYHESGKQFGFSESALHDVVPVAYLIEPEIFTGKYYKVDIILDGPARGMTLADKRKKGAGKNCILVLETVQRTRFIALMNESLQRLDKKEVG